MLEKYCFGEADTQMRCAYFLLPALLSEPNVKPRPALYPAEVLWPQGNPQQGHHSEGQELQIFLGSEVCSPPTCNSSGWSVGSSPQAAAAASGLGPALNHTGPQTLQGTQHSL